MQSLLHIEDLVGILYRKIINYEIVAQHQDIGPITNFSRTIDSGKFLTRKQGTFILQLLKKYRVYMDIPDIDEMLKTPVWKHDFRVIDNTKYMFLETDGDNVTWLNIKFPFSFKDQFVKEIFNGEKDPTRWDPNGQVRKVKLSNINLVVLVENALKNGFEVDDLVLAAVADVEEMWNNEDSLVPHSLIVNDRVELVNASETAKDYWNDHSTGVMAQDLMLAKQMGYILRHTFPADTAERIASSPGTSFWFTHPQRFFEYLDEVNVWPVVIILDRTPEPIEWTKEFIETFPLKNFNTEDVRVCFRPSNNSPAGQVFNDWLKERNLNKPVADGKIFLCQHKPPKWMFEKDFNIKVLASNSIYPSVNNITSTLIGSHPHVFYFDKVKPSAKRNSKIVEL